MCHILQKKALTESNPVTQRTSRHLSELVYEVFLIQQGSVAKAMPKRSIRQKIGDTTECKSVPFGYRVSLSELTMWNPQKNRNLRVFPRNLLTKPPAWMYVCGTVWSTCLILYSISGTSHCEIPYHHKINHTQPKRKQNWTWYEDNFLQADFTRNTHPDASIGTSMILSTGTSRYST